MSVETMPQKSNVSESSGHHMALKKRFLAEPVGTFWLVFGVCGSAVLAAGAREQGGQRQDARCVTGKRSGLARHLAVARSQ